MTLVTASIDIDAPPQKVFDTMLDPARLNEWVSIHRKVNDADDGKPHKGYEMEQTLCLRGANFKVKWKLTEFEPGEAATWEGRGPAHSYARTASLTSHLFETQDSRNAVQTLSLIHI